MVRELKILVLLVTVVILYVISRTIPRLLLRSTDFPQALPVFVEPGFRRSLKRLGKSPDDFCVVVYNILKDGVIVPGRYLPLSSRANRKGTNISSPRHRQFMKEVKWLAADIISFQEVEEIYYNNVLVKELHSLGFSGLLQLHGDKTNGVATFYKQTKFRIEKEAGYLCNQHNIAKQFCNLSNFKTLWKGHYDRVIQMVLLRDRQNGKQIAIANTHILFDRWRNPALQTLQAALFLHKLQEFVTSVGNGRAIPWVFGGDFNMRPYFPTYKLVTTGKLNEEEVEKLDVNKYKYPQVIEKDVIMHEENLFLKYCFDKKPTHSFQDIKSAYKTIFGSEPLLTHYQIDDYFPEVYGFKVMKDTLDYIFYSSDSLNVNAVLEPVKEEVIKPLIACPNKYFSSDHFPLKACFKIK